MKEETQAKTPKKQNILLRVLALLVTAALMLGAVALVAYRDRLNLDRFKRWLTYRTLETSEGGEGAPFAHAGGEKLSVTWLEDGLLFASAAGTHYYSHAGTVYAEEVLSMEHPVLSAGDRTGVVYDAGGQSLFLFRNREEQFRLTLEGGADLLSARANDSGWLAITAQQSGYKGAVTVYDDQGKEVIGISLSSTFLVDGAISPDSKTVAVVTMGQSGGTFATQVQFYPVDRTQPTHIVDLGSTTVLDLDYESGRLWVLGENALYILDPNGGEMVTYSFGTDYLKGCDLGGDGFAFLLLGRYRAGAATEALVVDDRGEAMAQLPLTGQVLDYDAAGNYCALLTGGELTIYTRYLEPYALLDHVQGARHTALAADGSALLADAQEGWLYIPD